MRLRPGSGVKQNSIEQATLFDLLPQDTPASPAVLPPVARDEREAQSDSGMLTGALSESHSQFATMAAADAQKAAEIENSNDARNDRAHAMMEEWLAWKH